MCEVYTHVHHDCELSFIQHGTMGCALQNKLVETVAEHTDCSRMLRAQRAHDAPDCAAVMLTDTLVIE